MSHRQFQMLRLFAKQSYTISEALGLNQNTFGSLCARRWVTYSYNKQGWGRFVLSSEGETMLEFYTSLNAYRQHKEGMQFSKKVKMGRKLAQIA